MAEVTKTDNFSSSPSSSFGTRKRSMEEQQTKSGMLTRLQVQQEVDGISVLEDRISSIYKQVNLDKSLIEQQSKLMEMEIFNEK